MADPNGGTPPGIEPSPRSLPVARLWVDGRAEHVDDARLEVPDGADGAWRVEARLPNRDPFSQAYGLSVQLDDGRTLHGRARLVSAADGVVTFEGTEVPGGAWPLARSGPGAPPAVLD